MSPWTDILSEAELEAYWARWAALDSRTAREARAWWRGLTADQLDIARRRAWLVPCGEDYQLAASYLALALAKAPVCEVIPHQPGRDRGQVDAVQILADGGRRLVTILPSGVTDYARRRGFLVIGPETLRLPADDCAKAAPEPINRACEGS